MAAAAIPLIVSGLSGLAGLFGGKPKQTTTTSDTTGTTTGSQDSNTFARTTPELSLIQQLLSNIAGTAAIDQFNKGPADLAGYTANGLQQINQAGDVQKKLSDNILAGRGLSYSPYAAYASMQPEINRTQQQSQFLAGIPLLAHSLQQGNIDELLKAFQSSGPFGSSSSSSGSTNFQQQQNSHTVGNSTTPGNPLAGAVGGFGAGLAATYPQLMQNFGGGVPTNPTSNPVQGWGAGPNQVP